MEATGQQKTDIARGCTWQACSYQAKYSSFKMYKGEFNVDEQLLNLWSVSFWNGIFLTGTDFLIIFYHKNKKNYSMIYVLKSALCLIDESTSQTISVHLMFSFIEMMTLFTPLGSGYGCSFTLQFSHTINI